MEETMELSAEAADQAAAVESEPAAPMLPEQDLSVGQTITSNPFRFCRSI